MKKEVSKNKSKLALLYQLYKDMLKKLEKSLPIFCVVFFVLGIWLAKKSLMFATVVDTSMNWFVNSYGYFAPLAIYIILTPSLAKMFLGRGKSGKKFITYAMLWFAKLRIYAAILGAVFTALVFGLPLYNNGTTGLFGAFVTVAKSMAWMLTHSPYFYAIYASILTIFLSLKIPKIALILQNTTDIVEKIGEYMVPLVPLFMLAIGSYVAHLPISIQNQVIENGATATQIARLNSLHFLGFTIHANTAGGMIMAYLAGAFLTAIACAVWHFLLLLFAKFKLKDFSIKEYFKKYWVRVYPLLWSTSSEALATPLNLHLIKKHYPKIKPEIRNFAVGAGSFLNINGTIICIFVLAGVVSGLLGLEISLLQLLLCIPLVFLLGYGVPGIPGELLLFAGPIAVLLTVPTGVLPIFLALYLGLQIGLPDSFRTGANSTDNCICALLLQHEYEKKFKNIVPEPEFWDNVFKNPHFYTDTLYLGFVEMFTGKNPVKNPAPPKINVPVAQTKISNFFGNGKHNQYRESNQQILNYFNNNNFMNKLRLSITSLTNQRIVLQKTRRNNQEKIITRVPIKINNDLYHIENTDPSIGEFCTAITEAHTELSEIEKGDLNYIG